MIHWLIEEKHEVWVPTLNQLVHQNRGDFIDFNERVYWYKVGPYQLDTLGYPL